MKRIVTAVPLGVIEGSGVGVSLGRGGGVSVGVGTSSVAVGGWGGVSVGRGDPVGVAVPPPQAKTISTQASKPALIKTRLISCLLVAGHVAGHCRVTSQQTSGQKSNGIEGGFLHLGDSLSRTYR